MMNERIKKLAEQAKGTKTPGFPVWKFYNTELEKFAELIVRECAQVVKDSHKYGNPMAKMVVRDASSAVKKHFGVEE